MAQEALDYGTILADMKAKRAALDASITALEAALASGTLGQFGTVPASSSGGSSSSSNPVELPVGALLGKSVPAAIKLYLSAIKRKQTNAELTTALREGGVESTGSLEKVVTGALLRLKASGEVLRFKDGWGLAELYNETFRAKLAQNQKPVAKPKKKVKPKAKAKPAPAKEAPAKAEPPTRKPQTDTPQAEHPAETKQNGGEQGAIEAFFRSHPGEEFTSAEIAGPLGIRIQTVGLICSKLAHQGSLEKTSTGKFRTARIHAMPKAV